MTRRDLTGLGPAHGSLPVQRWTEAGVERAVDEVAKEVPVAFVYNGVPFAVMLATPLDLEDFALGFSLTEGVIESRAEFEAVEVVPEKNGLSIYVSVPKPRADALAARRKNLAGRTGCGLCGEELLDNALRPVQRVQTGKPISARAVQSAVAALAEAQQLNAITGAVHAAAWADEQGKIGLVREDVGRHNALDKLIGALLRSGIDPAEGFILVTSRASYEMVFKTAISGAPLLAAVSAPTELAVRTAETAGVTLIGFTRKGRHTIYANPERLSA
jgi:FdhD protein